MKEPTGQKNRVRKRSCRENLWHEIQLKGHEDRNRHKNRIKRSGQARLVHIVGATSVKTDVKPDHRPTGWFISKT